MINFSRTSEQLAWFCIIRATMGLLLFPQRIRAVVKLPFLFSSFVHCQQLWRKRVLLLQGIFILKPIIKNVIFSTLFLLLHGLAIKVISSPNQLTLLKKAVCDAVRAPDAGVWCDSGCACTRLETNQSLVRRCGATPAQPAVCPLLEKK